MCDRAICPLSSRGRGGPASASTPSRPFTLARRRAPGCFSATLPLRRPRSEPQSAAWRRSSSRLFRLECAAQLPFCVEIEDVVVARQFLSHLDVAGGDVLVPLGRSLNHVLLVRMIHVLRVIADQ